jgi:hypothetical protein
MKRSSARRARCWVMHELTCGLDQFSDPSVRATLSVAGNRNEKTLPRGGQGLVISSPSGLRRRRASRPWPIRRVKSEKSIHEMEVCIHINDADVSRRSQISVASLL